MRIHDMESDKSIDLVGIYLTIDEAKRLRDGLEILIKDPEQHHDHITDSDYKKELILAVYTENNMDSFDSRSRRLILEDK